MRADLAASVRISSLVVFADAIKRTSPEDQLIPAATAGTARSTVPLRNIVAIAVSIGALVLAFALVDLGALAEAASRVSLSTLAIVILALMSGALLACARLACIASDLGYRMRASDAIAALSLGQLGGAIFFQLAGQLIARSAVLGRRGVPVAGTVLMTGYERVVAFAVSLPFALAGGWYLFGGITLDLEAGGAAFLKLVTGGTLAVVASAVLVWGRPALAFARPKLGTGAAWRLARSFALSFGIQICTITAYIAAVVGLAPDMGMIETAAAVAIVMLAASVPVSLAGWGVRELGAIYALGAIGLDRETALVVAVLVGAAALGVVAILAAASALVRVRPGTPVLPTTAPKIDTIRALAWGVPLLVSMAVLFQVHVPVSTSWLNVNLADPLAIIGASLFLLERLKARQLPMWRLSLFNGHIAVMTALIVIAFAHGWLNFGVTAWALTNRLAGWFVLLAYLATGALIVGSEGERGLVLLLRTYTVALLSIVALEFILLVAARLGVAMPQGIISFRSEGFSQNPNAFALLLLFAITATVSVIKDSKGQTAALALGMLGLWLSGSRAGLIALSVVLLVGLALRAVRISRLVAALVLTAAGIAFIEWLPQIVGSIVSVMQSVAGEVVAFLTPKGTGATTGPAAILTSPHFSPFMAVASGYESSNTQRILSFQQGAEMFEAAPIFGAGLGAFMEWHTRTYGGPLVIHSTALWLLAEMGIVGLFVFVAPFVRVLKHETRDASPHDPVRSFLILSLLAFATIAAVHDVMYQRGFWLLIGAALALQQVRGSEKA